MIDETWCCFRHQYFTLRASFRVLSGDDVGDSENVTWKWNSGSEISRKKLKICRAHDCKTGHFTSWIGHWRLRNVPTMKKALPNYFFKVKYGNLWRSFRLRSQVYLSSLLLYPLSIAICVHFADKDECATSETNQCDANALCTNTGGSYVCRCIKGYQGDGLHCQGIFKKRFLSVREDRISVS